MRRFCKELERNRAIMGMRNTTTTLSNFIDSSCYMQSKVVAGKKDNSSTSMKRAGILDSSIANHNMLEGARRQLMRPQGMNISEEEQTEIASWDYCWKRHVCSLSIFAEYQAQQSGTVLQLSTLEQPYLTTANYIIYLKPQGSDAFIIQARNSISTLFELIGKPMVSKWKKIIEQLMKENVDKAAQVRKELRYQKLSQLMLKISKQATLRVENKLNSDQLMKVALTLIMVYTVLRMADVQRAELRIQKADQGEIITATMTMKKP
ncbi:MAG: hypothetical protein EZS28_035302, partial [Streblomastix strix]